MKPSSVFNTSKQFYLAALRADEQRIIAGSQFEWLPIPAIVCAAFSIETGLKAVILAEKFRMPKGHLLDDLFDELSSDSKMQLVGNAHVTRSPQIEGQPDTFEIALEKIRHAFIDWRYIHEKTDWTSIDKSFLFAVASVVQDLAGKKAASP